MGRTALSLRQKTSEVVDLGDESDDYGSLIEVVSRPPSLNSSAHSASSDDEDDSNPVAFDPRRSHAFSDHDTSPRSKFNARRRRLEQKFSRTSKLGDDSEEDDLSQTSPFREKDYEVNDTDTAEEQDDFDDFIDDDEGDDYYEGHQAYLFDQETGRKGAKSRSRKSLQINEEDSDDDLSIISLRRSPAPAIRQPDHVERESFRKLISKIEIPEDKRKLYPESLQQAATADTAHENKEEAILGSLKKQPNVRAPIELDLDQFIIYENVQLSGKGTGGQLLSLFLATTATKKKDIRVDGILLSLNGRQRVIGLRVSGWTIDSLLDPSVASIEGQFFLHTIGGQVQQVRYRLKSPAPEYQSIWESFVWVADFTKYTFHYLWAKALDGERVSLDHFREDFWTFITMAYDGPAALFLKKWSHTCDDTTDFRKHVIRYASFMRSEALSLKTQEELQLIAQHDLWKEIGLAFNNPKPRQLGAKEKKTVVTAEIASAFLQTFPIWGSNAQRAKSHDLFDIVKLRADVAQARDRRRGRLNFPEKDTHLTTQEGTNFLKIDGLLVSRAALVLQEASRNTERPEFVAQQVLGTAVVVDRGRDFQFAYVKELATDPEEILVVWLALPAATICGNSKANSFCPIGNELFFTDKCSCRSVSLRDIVGSYQVDTFSWRSSSPDGFFVHALYRQNSNQMVTSDPLEVLSGCMRHSHKDLPGTPGLPSPDEVSKLTVQSLFSGCGLLDHSMSSTEYMDTVFALEIDEAALLSHKANTKNSDCRHIRGSTNAILRDVCNGREPYQDIDITVAGCPCKGFSQLTADKSTRNSHKNCSLLANTLSWISVFSPRYVLIENVPQMDSANKEGANACAQAICVLVSLGYQVTKMRVSGTDVNGPSSRCRLFVIAAAPGLVLPQNPIAHATGQPTNAHEAIQDLDPVDNDTALNPSRPDHVPFERLKVDFDAGVALRDVVRRVPLDGRHRDLYAAKDLGRLTDVQQKWFQSLTVEKREFGSGSLRRVAADALFPTITCAPVPLNSRGFACIHPFQDRVLTLHEIRRGQGLPDDFLLIGPFKEAAKQIGNGVVWEVGVAWGLAIAEAAYASGVTRRLPDGKRKATSHVEQQREDREDSVEFLGERPVKKARY